MNTYSKIQTKRFFNLASYRNNDELLVTSESEDIESPFNKKTKAAGDKN
jgi:hypothetical protein